MALNTHSLDLERSSSQYATITDANQTGLDLTTDMTIECWVKFESLSIVQALAGKWNAGGTFSYLFYMDASDDPNFITSVNGTNTYNNVWTGLTINTDTWYHLAIAFDASAGSAELYLDTSSEGALTGYSTTTADTSAEFTIGANGIGGTPANYLDGLIDEVRVWSDIRTSGEIADNYNVEIAGDATGLVGYWQFEEDYLDLTSNDNDLTAAASPVFSTDVPFVGGASTFVANMMVIS